jgi:mRNA interferase RelE/StbE
MYHVALARTAKEDLARLDKPVAQRVLDKIRWMSEHFEQIAHEPLTGEWEGVFKLRIGDHRVLYTFDSSTSRIIVHFILSAIAAMYIAFDSRQASH